MADCTDALPAHFERDGYRIGRWGRDDHGACRQCATAIPGVFDPEPGGFDAPWIPVRASQAA